MDRYLGFDRLHNFRDLGGYPAAGEQLTRSRVLYRSDNLAKLHEPAAKADRARFDALGIRTVVDLRHDWELTRSGRVPAREGLAFHRIGIEHRPWDQAATGPLPDPWRYLADKLGEIIADGGEEIAEVIGVLAHSEGPAVFHCASGKDRTGIIAALVLTLLGVDRDTVAADFALTERATARLRADWSARNEGRAPGWEHYGRAPEAVIRHLLDDLDRDHGGVAAYVAAHGVPETTVTALRARFLVPAGEPAREPAEEPARVPAEDPGRAAD
ncbi:tyrosine-protein phosphatase [Streptomyces sp. SID11233]|uniref:tyrosine-protein phosphatase n=1 Tax=Streptomyces sp. SID11385 TaxID=2706031 RepID=UPI0013BF8983|nr:tyrosine-protein phosphatase [Streptomyces sp. SID11385]NED79891.1 tyrosine-protein phosphatase [Streptomyces sp. SID11233]